MAISPPSDIVLDVASAADPVKLKAATDRLASLAADPSLAGTSFADALAATRQKSAAAAIPLTPAPTLGFANARTSLNGSAPKDQLKVMQKFEAVLLQNFVEAILPKDAELFGDEKSSEIYRSMMSEQIANQIAKSGRLGIAKQVLMAHSRNSGSAATSASAVPAMPVAPAMPIVPNPLKIDRV